MEACKGSVGTLEGLQRGQTVAEMVVVRMHVAVVLHLNGGRRSRGQTVKRPRRAERVVVVDLGVVITANRVVLNAESALGGIVQNFLHLILTVRDATAHVVVIAKHGGVGEVFGMQVKVLFGHPRGVDHAIGIRRRVSLAPSAHRAHVNALDSGIAVEFIAQHREEFFKAR